MQFSTLHNGTIITGVVVERSSYFLEVAITSPFTKLSTSRRMSADARRRKAYEGELLESECSLLLVELYELANSCLK